MSNGHTAWMPVYWRDFLSETAHLSPAELGAYTALFGSYWTNGGALPGEPEKLRRIARMDAEEWAAVAPAIAQFFEVRDGRWFNAKIETSLSEAKIRYAKRADAGRKGGQARGKQWHGNASAPEQAMQRQAVANAEVRQDQAQSEAHESPFGDSVTPPQEATAQKKDDLDLPAFLDRRSKKNGTRIPENWDPGESGRQYARQQGLDPVTIENIADQFRDYWRSRSGPEALKVDWNATWRTWLRNHIARHGRGPWPGDGGRRSAGHGSDRASPLAAARAILADAALPVSED